jgi:hypothetical protein
MKLKKMLSILVSLMVLIHICSGTALAAETGSTDIAVDYAIGETVLQLDISDIPVVNARQMLSILLIHKDADVNNVSTNDVLYSNSFYLNGKDSVTIDVDYYETEIMEYRLIIKDSHAGIDYSQLLAIKVKAYTAQQYAGYREAGKKEGPKERGYVFAGWFSDKKCTKVLSSATVEEKAYAKFVDANVLTVKAQITAGTGEDSKKTNMRFVTTVDSLDYEKIGFVVTIEGREEQTVSTTVVYEQLYAVGNNKTVDTLAPSEEFSPISLYFGAYSYLNIPTEDFDTKFTVTPYWITLDGTTVYGETAVKTVSMGYDKEVM